MFADCCFVWVMSLPSLLEEISREDAAGAYQAFAFIIASFTAQTGV